MFELFLLTLCGILAYWIFYFNKRGLVENVPCADETKAAIERERLLNEKIKMLQKEIENERSLRADGSSLHGHKLEGLRDDMGRTEQSIRAQTAEIGAFQRLIDSMLSQISSKEEELETLRRYRGLYPIVVAENKDLRNQISGMEHPRFLIPALLKYEWREVKVGRVTKCIADLRHLIDVLSAYLPESKNNRGDQ